MTELRDTDMQSQLNSSTIPQHVFFCYTDMGEGRSFVDNLTLSGGEMRVVM